MSNESLKSPSDIPDDKPVKVGTRGGFRYDSNDKSNPFLADAKAPDPNIKPPSFVIIGPGIDMAFFRGDGGVNIKHKGPYCKDAIDLAKSMSSAGESLRSIVDEICKEFNAKIVGDV